MKRLLLVDDDPHLLESAKDILEDSGYPVEAVGTLAAARAAFAQTPADFLIIDFNLPDGKGPELARELKASHPTLKVLLMTGEINAVLGADATLFTAVLTKPVDPTTLLTLLTAL